jgi:hypothetical protein
MVVAWFTRDRFDLRKRQATNARAGLEPAHVYLETATRRAELGKVLVHLRDAATQVGIPLDQHHLPTCFGGLDSRTYPANAPADNKDLALSTISAHRASSSRV